MHAHTVISAENYAEKRVVYLQTTLNRTENRAEISPQNVTLNPLGLKVFSALLVTQKDEIHQNLLSKACSRGMLTTLDKHWKTIYGDFSGPVKVTYFLLRIKQNSTS